MNAADDLVRYTMDYVQYKHKLTPTQANRFVLNPDIMFAGSMEQFINFISIDSDSMSAVRSRSYDAPCLAEINSLLDSFANTYASNEPEIMKYLRAMGHPLGKQGGSGCLLMIVSITVPLAALVWLFC
ncbi:MAG: hypothetical protein A2283_18850 [Lentisphaerae bacterium RIFOXYA12_FULL_48_11]|nr:MAG: hypothetical protein A2283_18850 [Lentisphaerae bacterium RIFOXYA12_FULL_48_11]